MSQIIILDGSMGMELKRRRPKAAYDLDMFSAKALIHTPKEVQKIHEDYIKAGATILTTNTYATTQFYLSKSKVPCDQTELIKLACQLAKQAIAKFPAKTNLKIAGALPPLNESYRDDLVPDREKMLKEYGIFVRTMKDDVDFWLCETVSSFQEVLAMYDTIRKYSEKQIWFSFTCNENCTAMRDETSWSNLFNTLNSFTGIEAVLLNCVPCSHIEKSLREIKKHNTKNFITGGYANIWDYVPRDWVIQDNGDGCQNCLKVKHDLKPNQYIWQVQKWVDNGATVVGGCCGIGPEHIRALSAHFNSRKKRTESGSLAYAENYSPGLPIIIPKLSKL